ncbi:unnamed protein product [Cylindrotheca closterium]|uniref:PDZ domain-containing protein n=1 Tax=Cylindrotheca closterium TaxID=2856 RepID=A0AAD2GB96_9STRA|nr:unnamed protein product [Cylindrotheca closterium]
MTAINSNTSTTNNDNKKTTNLLQKYNVKDLLWASITKPSLKQNAGLHLMEDEDGVIRVERVDGAFEMFTQVKPGDRLLEFQEQDVSCYEGGIKEIEKLIKESLKVQVRVLKPSADVEEEEDDDDDTSAMTLEIAAGDTLVLHYGTNDKDGLNGKMVKIKRESSKKGRWLVQVQDTGKMMIVDEAHLFAISSFHS